MKWHSGIGQDVLDKASLIECTCMCCQKVSEICEVIWTEHEESYKGYEVWVYCADCNVETFKMIKPL